MNIFGKYVNDLRNYVGSYKLTISGEIKIRDLQGTKLLQLTEDDRKNMRKTVSQLQEKFPYLQMQVRENLVEASIKFFVYKKYIAESNFLEEFRSALAGMLQDINGKNNLLASVNASGNLFDKDKQQQFVFLSKASMVEYKITDQLFISGMSDIMLHKITVYGISLFFAALICYELYVLYMYIPDHDPSKLLINVFTTDGGAASLKTVN